MKLIPQSCKSGWQRTTRLMGGGTHIVWVNADGDVKFDSQIWEPTSIGLGTYEDCDDFFETDTDKPSKSSYFDLMVYELNDGMAGDRIAYEKAVIAWEMME